MKTEKMARTKNVSDTRILVLDDDPFILKLIYRTLSSNGFPDVLSESSPVKALKHFGIEKLEDIPNKALRNHDSGIDLVISDIVMPGIDGFQVCQAIKKVSPATAVILISGYEIQEVDTRMVESGADDFLLKPFNTNELLTRIRMLVRKKQLLNTMTGSITREPVITIKRSFSLPYIGDTIGDFVIIDFLGWGQATVIYKVVDRMSREVFALKMLTNAAISDRESSKRFENEASMLEQINHPNVIRFMSKGRVGDTPYFVMEYVDGMDLEELLITRGKIDEGEFFRIARGIADGIAAIHAKGIVHRDIKLKNILYEHRSRNIKISDFGIAMGVEALNITREGFVMGTPLYIAPELLFGAEPNFKSDIYSYGATVYHLLSGSPPFTAPNSKELANKLKEGKPPPKIKSIRNDLRYDWDSVITDKCLALNPEDRPDSMIQVINSMEALMR